MWFTCSKVVWSTTALRGVLRAPTLFGKNACRASAHEWPRGGGALTRLACRLRAVCPSLYQCRLRNIVITKKESSGFAARYNTLFSRHLLQAADGTGLSHERAVNAVHPPVNSEVRPSHGNVSADLE